MTQNLQSWPLTFVRSLALLTVAFGNSACSNVDDSWTEQVQLDGGEMLLVKVHLDSNVLTPLGGASESFTIKAEYQILDQSPPIPLWSDQRDPVLLMRDPATNEFVLVVTSMDHRVWEAHGGPRSPPYWMFRLRAGAWVEEPIKDFVFGRPTNLVQFPSLASEVKGVVTLQQKANWLEHEGLFRSYGRVEKSYKYAID
jgi:hypothetical protein